MTTGPGVRVVPLLGAMLVAAAAAHGQSLATPDRLACAPRLAPDEPAPGGVVLGAPDDPLRAMFSQGDALLLSVGRAEGVSVGTQFFTRREAEPMDVGLRDQGIRLLRTTGWLRAAEVDEHASLAVVDRICTDVRTGDRLAPFQWPAVVRAAPAGAFGYDDPATVLFGPDGRSVLRAGQLLVIDQGAEHDIVPGQRLTIFRASPRGADDPVTRLGEAVAVLVEPGSATAEVIQARETIRSGDFAAVHR